MEWKQVDRGSTSCEGRDERGPMWSGPRGSEAERKSALPFFALFRGAGPSLPKVARDKGPPGRAPRAWRAR
jgi:hypothetical protein